MTANPDHKARPMPAGQTAEIPCHELSRRALMAGAAALAAAQQLGGRAARADAGGPAAAGARLQEIAPGVFVHTGRHAVVGPDNLGDISNASFIIGTDAVAVIDTGGSAKAGQALRAAIASVTDRPVRYVINTHMHPDHVFGNAAFEGAQTEFIGHHKLPAALTARTESYLRRNREMIGDAGFEGTRMVLPTRTVSDMTEIDLGGRKLQLKARPTAHTDNDLTVFDATTQTFILGDLLFSEHIPTIDGSIVGWLKLIETLKTEPAKRAVGGHGPAAMPWPAAIEPLARYLTTVANEVRAAIKAGKTLSEATETVGQSEKDKWQVFGEHHVRNVTAAFAELEWE